MVDEDGEGVEVNFSMDEDRTPSEAVIGAVAETDGDDPVDLPPLYQTLDPDALDTLVGKRGSVRVQFQYAGPQVIVGSHGKVTVREGYTDESQ